MTAPSATAIDPSDLAEIVWMLAPLRREPRADAPLDTEALRGETVALGPEEEGWVRARLTKDSYEGWLPAEALGPLAAAPSHRVTVARTLAFPGPDIKRPPIAALTMGARVRIVGIEGRFAVTDAREFLVADHLAPIERVEADFIAVAERLLGTPYLWGGKSALGIDCSGLLQLSLGACGIAAPRDSGQQETALGEALPLDAAPEALARGDLLFWSRHVAIARGDGTILHANAHHMLVAIEPAAVAIARIAASGQTLRALKRLTW